MENFTVDNHFHIVMEVAISNLEEHKETLPLKLFPLSQLRQIAKQSLSALQYLHSQGFTHRDIKPPNILVTKVGTRLTPIKIKIADFGIASEKIDLATLCGTPGWLAPEILKAAVEKAKNPNYVVKYTNAVDIWCLGTILNQLLDDLYNLHRHQPEMGKIFAKP